MIAAVVVLAGTVLVAGAAAIAWSVLGSKLLAGLVGLVGTVLVGFVTVASLSGRPVAPAMGSFSHEQLEADRLMTQQMAVALGPGMQVQMAGQGMLERSGNDAYLRALEQHVSQVDRMLGRTP